MARLVLLMSLVGSLALPAGAVAGGTSYEPTHPPRIAAATAEASAFYLEFRAREEPHGFGHAYVTLGAVEAGGRVEQTVVAGFMPKSADDDRWSRFGLPVAGLVGVTRSDFVRRPVVRFRVGVDRATYYRVVNEIRGLRRTWTTYELLVRNCNNFVSQIASSVGLHTPLLTAQLPVRYVRELRALNARLSPA